MSMMVEAPFLSASVMPAFGEHSIERLKLVIRVHVLCVVNGHAY